MNPFKSKTKYSTLQQFVMESKNTVKQRPLSQLECALDPDLFYQSWEEKILTIPCSTQLPLGITQVSGPHGISLDLLSTYQKKNTSKVHDPNSFSKYLVGGGTTVPQRGQNAWNETSTMFCQSRRQGYDPQTRRCTP